jgi:hypothetical protein
MRSFDRWVRHSFHAGGAEIRLPFCMGWSLNVSFIAARGFARGFSVSFGLRGLDVHRLEWDPGNDP